MPEVGFSSILAHFLVALTLFSSCSRSWFIDSTIESNGHVYFATSMDPLLLLLPYLRSTEKKVPLDQLVSSVGGPGLENVQTIVESKKLAGPKRMEKIADSKGRDVYTIQ